MNKLITVADAAALIASGRSYGFAGPEAALDRLPAGSWIAGTIPYFMLADGGRVVRDDHVFATELSSIGEISIASYGPDELAQIASRGPDNGFAYTIIPAGGACHHRYAEEAADYPDTFLRPAVGWISGVHLSELGAQTAKVYDGRTAAKFDDRAVVAYVQLAPQKTLAIEIVNPCDPDAGDAIEFDTAGFVATSCKVNGVATPFADYVRRRGLAHGKQPLVGDYAGAHINVSLQQVGDVDVAMYAPVFPGVTYRFAAPVADYAAAFRERIAAQSLDGAVMACNCILNFVFGELEGKAVGGVAGPVTFGEIAYQLLNQTMVLVRVTD